MRLSNAVGSVLDGLAYSWWHDFIYAYAQVDVYFVRLNTFCLEHVLDQLETFRVFIDQEQLIRDTRNSQADSASEWVQVCTSDRREAIHSTDVVSTSRETTVGNNWK